MTQSEFNHILGSINALSPDQMRQLRRELDSKLASVASHTGESDPVLGSMRDAAEVLDAVVGEAMEKRRADPAKPIWERILERSAAIPDEEWDKLPVDGAEQHDHYLYGTPKRSPSP
jgi:hypothetical protein